MRAGGVSQGRIISTLLSRWLPQLLRRLRTAPAVLARFQYRLRKAFGRTVEQQMPVGPRVFQTVMEEPESGAVSCQVQIKPQSDGTDVFDVQLRGTIEADVDASRAQMRLCGADVTEPLLPPQPIYKKVSRWIVDRERSFEHKFDLGKLCGKRTEITDWMSTAQIRADSLSLPRKGNRQLRFTVSIICSDDARQLARCHYRFSYENKSYGYLDIDDNTTKAKALAVPLALAITAAQGKIYKHQFQLICDWAKSNLARSFSRKNLRMLDQELKRTLRFFRDGCKLDLEKLCAEVAEIAPLPVRYEIVQVCLNVTAAAETFSARQLEMINAISQRLELDPEKFRSMVEKVTPICRGEPKEMGLILGLGAQMDKEQIRTRLNSEYRKWNARVTCLNPSIQTQAEHMLNLIMQARTQYIG